MATEARTEEAMALRRDASFSGGPLLYLIATPIGNLGEISDRFREVVQEMDYIAAEDTRNSSILLQKIGIKKPFISCHEHNEEEASEKIIALLMEGKKVAYMSDAGYPLLSDPGARLVRNLVQHGIKVSVVNGPSALLPALVGSGLMSDRFFFYGFLPPRPREREKELRSLKLLRTTIVFYEAPHRIQETIPAMARILGKRDACIARELTKVHEEYIRGTLQELSDLVQEETLKGEMVIIVEGAKEEALPVPDEPTILEALQEELLRQSPGQATKAVAERFGMKKGDVYEIYLRSKGKSGA